MATIPPAPALESPAGGHQVSQPWRLTTYYTAVEQYRHGKPVEVNGCPVQDCEHGHADLGGLLRVKLDGVDSLPNESTIHILSCKSCNARFIKIEGPDGVWETGSIADELLELGARVDNAELRFRGHQYRYAAAIAAASPTGLMRN